MQGTVPSRHELRMDTFSLSQEWLQEAWAPGASLVGCWMLGAGCWIFDAGCLMLGAGGVMLDVEWASQNTITKSKPRVERRRGGVSCKLRLVGPTFQMAEPRRRKRGRNEAGRQRKPESAIAPRCFDPSESPKTKTMKRRGPSRDDYSSKASHDLYDYLSL